jgi:hypothetical protein
MKKLFYYESTKGRKHERKEKFRVFVINPFLFPDNLGFLSEPAYSRWGLQAGG